MIVNPRNGSFPALQRRRRPTSDGERPLRIAMIGQKGLPATHGGVERHVEEIGARLADLGDDVTVYCRSSYTGRWGDGHGGGVDGVATDGTYRGMHLRPVAALGTKHLDAITHSAASTAAAMHMHADIVHYHALGPGLLAPAPRMLSRAGVVLTVHGLDNERSKWSGAARAALGAAHWMSARVPDVTVAVSHALVEHYAHEFGREAVYVPNGVVPRSPCPSGAALAQYGLRPGGYLLFVGRLVPEKAADLLIRAYRRVPGGLRLVIAGGSSFTDDYVASLHRLARRDQRVVLSGYVYGDRLAELYSNAAAFVLPSNLEGMALTLLEAVSYGLPVVASDIAPNREIAGEQAGYRLFRTGDEEALAAALLRVLAGGQAERAAAARLRERVLADHCWDTAARQMREIYLELVREPATSRRAVHLSVGG
ncbi:glycosyltransferase family 4 protein [Nocardioides xinjiangensis]|uniref:glycosyltransferase family 4 protein n=1 Tax=Nocardioides xinjiangensis TaxID=2817376 RepID=UPI001B304273|nr:glycosyltransferase family 4 protein [Nocardioides sp. SYSU D00514]